MEMQMVFEQNSQKSPNTPFQKYVIISVLFEEGDMPSHFLDNLKIGNMPRDPGYKKNIDYNIDLNTLFSKDKGMFGERFILESY